MSRSHISTVDIVGERIENRIEEQILRSLREFYPIKADEVVIISAVRKEMEDVNPDHVSHKIRSLRDE